MVYFGEKYQDYHSDPLVKSFDSLADAELYFQWQEMNGWGIAAIYDSELVEQRRTEVENSFFKFN